MTTRRSFLAGTALFAAHAAMAKTQQSCAVFTKATQSEITFDQRLGDLFVVRVAGNFVNVDIRYSKSPKPVVSAPPRTNRSCKVSRIEMPRTLRAC